MKSVDDVLKCLSAWLAKTFRLFSFMTMVGDSSKLEKASLCVSQYTY